MKKLLTLVLCTALLLSGCGNTVGSETKAPETNAPVTTEAETGEVNTQEPETGRFTLTALKQAGTREELAALIGVENPTDMVQMMAYLNNYYYHLPYDGDSAAPAGEWSLTEDGRNCLTLAQAKALITPTVLTTENWREHLEYGLKTVREVVFSEDGNESVEEREQTFIAFNSSFYFDGNMMNLQLTNTLTGEELEFDGSYWPEELLFEEGSLYTVSYDESGSAQKTLFSPEDYTCTFANGVLYAYNIPNELCYVDTSEYLDPEETEYFHPTEEDWENPQTSILVIIRYGSDDSDICYVGYNLLGRYVYIDADSQIGDAKRPVSTLSDEPLTPAVLQQLKTREELAAALGVSDASRLKQLLTYLKNYYYHTPSAAEETNPGTEWGVTEDGCYYLTPAQVKAMVTPIVLTAENWSEYICPNMESYEHISFDEDGKETYEIRQEPDISVPEQYYSAWESVMVLRNNETGSILEFERNDWPEAVSLIDGKFCVTPMNESGFGVSQEYDSKNYSCLYIDYVIYSYEVPEELLYVEYYDETAEDWAMIPVAEYQGEEEPYPYVVVWDPESDAGRCHYGYNTLGNVFTD